MINKILSFKTQALVIILLAGIQKFIHINDSCLWIWTVKVLILKYQNKKWGTSSNSEDNTYFLCSMMSTHY